MCSIISNGYILFLLTHFEPIMYVINSLGTENETTDKGSKGSCCFLEQETLPSLLRAGWFEEGFKQDFIIKQK